MTGRRDRTQSHTAPDRGQQGDRQETFVIARIVQQVIPDDAPDPKPNRETRRAMKRAARKRNR